jgi:N-acetylglucosaminyldiphosphoundecaprenol N-acetyl-beta-D-mannosaminyltransferase
VRFVSRFIASISFMGPSILGKQVERVTIAGVGFDRVSMAEAVAAIIEMARLGDRPRYVCTGNLDHLAQMQKDEAFRVAYQSADLVLADGMPVVWLSRLCPEGRLEERVAGSDLFWELASASESADLRLFLLGGAPGAAEGAAQAVRSRFPDAQICGMYCPSFEEFGTVAEESRIAAAIRAADPNVLLVAFGAPKQEKWILSTMEVLRIPVSIGVGGSFEMAAGIVRRAPGWMQRSGTEWIHRLMQEPQRMWRRYICRDLPFFAVLLIRTLQSRASHKH